MSIAQLSPKSIASDPAYVNPQVKIDQRTSVVENSQLIQKSDNTRKSDSVTISRAALQKAGNADTDIRQSRQKEVSDSSAEENKERFSAMV